MWRSWRVDETYVRVSGKWAYLYRAVDKRGWTINFYLSSTRNAKAARRFLGKSLAGLKDWETPSSPNTDKAAAFGVAIAELKAEGKCPTGPDPPTGQISQQCNRGGSRRAEAPDKANPRLPIDEDGLRHAQGLRGHARAEEGPSRALAV
jgi:transposase-like protein